MGNSIMSIFDLFSKTADELKDNAAEEIAKGHSRGVNVAELQKSLNEYTKGNDPAGSGLLGSLSRFYKHNE